MIKYFDAVMELLHIENDTYSDAAQYILDYPDMPLLAYHKHAFLFRAWRDCVRKDISLEEFVKVGDIDAVYALQQDGVSSFDVDISWFSSDTVYIVDHERFSGSAEALANKSNIFIL